jgi:hypothetical protein
LQRDRDLGTEAEYENVGTQRQSSRASRRGASLVFLGAWTLFGVGTIANNTRTFSPSGGTSIGRVLSVGEPCIPSAPADVLPVNQTLPNLVVPTAIHFDNTDGRPPYDRRHDHHPTQPSAERVLGRIFAWLCTTLYLTSRLPQIWKNVRVFFARAVTNFTYCVAISLSESLSR